MSNSIITIGDLRCIPRHILRELYDLDYLHKLGIYFEEIGESGTYLDTDGGDEE